MIPHFQRLALFALMFSSLALSGATRAQDAESVPLVQITSLQSPTTVRLERVEESANTVKFRIEAQGPITLRVTPREFPIRAGQLLSVNTSYDGPMYQRAQRDGSVDLRFDAPKNSTIVIEDAKGGNLLGDFASFERGDNLAANGWETDKTPRILAGMGWGHEEMPKMGLPSALGAGAGVAMSSFARSGQNAVRLTKTDKEDTVAIQTVAGVPVEAGQKYTALGWYHTINPQFGSNLLLIARVDAPGKETTYTRARAMSPLIYSTPEQPWQAALARISVPKDYQNATMSLYVAATGAPFQSDWDDFEIRVTPTAAPLTNRTTTPAQTEARFSEWQVLERLKTRQPVRSEVVNSRWMINGEPVPQLAFTSHTNHSAWPTWSAHNDFFDSGIKLTWVPAWSAREKGSQETPFGASPWRGDGKYDFTAIENQIKAVLMRDPDAVIGLYGTLFPDMDFGDRHPEAVWVNARGEKVVGEKGNAFAATKRPDDQAWAISYSAPAYRQGVESYMRALGQFLAQSPYGKAVCGYHMAVGSDGQWFHHDWSEGAGELDYSAGAVAAYRDWLRARYNGDENAFKIAWNNWNASFATATLPSDAELNAPHYLFDPKTERRLIDANYWSLGGAMETANAAGLAFKAGLGRPTVVTTYFPNKHDAWEYMLSAPGVDGFVGVPEYSGWRQLGRGGEIAGYPASMRLHNKFFIMEMDYRSENSDTWGNDAFRYEWTWTRGAEDSAHQMRRDYGAVAAQGQGSWLYSLPGNTWATPDHMKYVRETFRVAQRAAQNPMPSDARQIAVFSDDNSEKYASRWNLYDLILRHAGNRVPRMILDRSGLSWDHYVLSDLGHPKLPDYKMVVFLTSGTITPAQVNWVRRNLQGNGKVMLWVHNPGISTAGVSGFPQVSRALTGMTLGVDTSNKEAHRYVAVGDDPLAQDADNLLTETAGPLFYVDDARATPLARFTDPKSPDGSSRVAMAVVRNDGPNGKWTSVYSSLLAGFSPTLLRNLAKEAGLTPVGPLDDVTFAGNGFLTLHATSAGEKTLRWTGKSDLLDLTSEEIVARGVESYSFPMKAQTTRWFARVNGK